MKLAVEENGRNTEKNLLRPSFVPRNPHGVTEVGTAAVGGERLTAAP